MNKITTLTYEDKVEICQSMFNKAIGRVCFLIEGNCKIDYEALSDALREATDQLESLKAMKEAKKLQEAIVKKPMTVGELKNLIKDYPDTLEIMTVNLEKSLCYSRIKKVYKSVYRNPKDEWLTFELKET